MSDMSTYEYNLLNDPIGVFGISDIPTIFQISLESKECPICFELIDGSKGSVTTSCGHCFCCECFAQSIDRGNGNCAICRHKLTQPRNTNLDINTITDNSKSDDLKLFYNFNNIITHFIYRLHFIIFFIQQIFKIYMISNF